MNTKLALILSVIVISGISATAQEFTIEDYHEMEWRLKAERFRMMQRLEERDDILDQSDYDMKYAGIDLDVTNIAGQIITGEVTMRSESTIDDLTEIVYDFHDDMIVDSVQMGGHDVTYNHADDFLTIALDRAYNTGEDFTTTVYYHGHPLGSGFGSFTWRTHAGQPIISSMSCPDASHEWWPCKDHPHDKIDSVDMVVTCPDDLVVSANGLFVSNVNNGNGTRTFTWHTSYPISTYLVCLYVTNYRSFTDWYVNADGDSMPINNYVYPEHYANAVEDLSIAAEAIGIYAQYFGEYPFFEEQYGHSIFPFSGGMEHQTNTGYGSILITGYHHYDELTVHELSHMWFGDMISPHVWEEVWMNEGFASYCEALWTEYTAGFDEYLTYMRFSLRVTDPSGPIYDPSPMWSSNTVYHKGAWVLHMLRGVMGDDAFFEGMYAYANHPDFMYKTTTTRRFQALMEQYYATDLDWYFDQWIWERNRPTYEFSWIKEDIGGGRFEIFLHIDQTQSSPAPELFIMPIKVYPEINGVDTCLKVFNDAVEDDFRFIVNGDPADLALDKYYWILCNLREVDYGMNIVTTDLPDSRPNQQYYETIEARGGTTPYTFALQDGELPPGLELNGQTGAVSGTPTVIGHYDFTIRCTDSSQPQLTDDQSYHVYIGEPSGVSDDETVTPSKSALLRNYPNPFNSSTVIKLRLGENCHAELEIFDLLGRKVASLHDGYLESGQHEFTWNADGISSGIYFYRLTAGNKSQTRKMALVK
jgi:aminopeptidase N